jgi:hypothetical protein
VQHRIVLSVDTDDTDIQRVVAANAAQLHEDLLVVGEVTAQTVGVSTHEAEIDDKRIVVRLAKA